MYVNVVVAVIPKVLAHKHLLNDVPVTVEPYYKWLGSAATGITHSHAPQDSHLIDTVSVAAEPKVLDYVMHTPALKTEIETQLNRDSCVILWPESHDQPLQLKFKNTSGQNCPTHDWTNKCQSVMDRFLSEIKCDTINILQEIWNGFKTQVEQQIKRRDFVIRCEFDDDHCNLNFVGKKDASEKFKTVAESIKTSLEEELRKKCEHITETVESFSRPQLMILRLCNYADEVTAAVKDVKVDITENEVHITGMTDDVKHAKLKLLEKVSQLHSGLMTVSEAQAELLEKDCVKSHLLECFRHQQVVASWTVRDTEVTVFAFNKDQSLKAQDIIQSEVVENKVVLSTASKSLMSQPKWKEFQKQLIDEHKMVVVHEGKEDYFVLCCVKECSAVVQEQVWEFIEKNSLVQVLVPLMRPIADLLEQCMSSDLEKITSKLTPCGGHLKRADGESEPGFVLLGSQSAVQSAKRDLLTLVAESVAMYDHDIDRPGVPAYLMSTPGTSILSDIQRKHQVVIDLENYSPSTQKQAAAAAAAAGPAPVVKYSRKVTLTMCLYCSLWLVLIVDSYISLSLKSFDFTPP